MLTKDSTQLSTKINMLMILIEKEEQVRSFSKDYEDNYFSHDDDFF